MNVLAIANRLKATFVASGIATGGSTTTVVDTGNRREATDDYWKGALIVMLSGNAAFQSRHIVAFSASSDTITVSEPFTAAVAEGDDYVIVPADSAGDAFRLVKKTITLGTGAVPVTENLFTVTGEIEAYFFGFIDAAVTSGGALTLEAGVTGNTPGLIAITAVAQLAINRYWVDTTTAVGVHAVPGKALISAANILHVIRDAPATAGTITYYLLYRPISTDGYAVPA